MINIYTLIFIIVISLSIINGMYLATLRTFDTFLPHDSLPAAYPVTDFSIHEKQFKFVKVDEIPGFIYLSLMLSRITNLPVESSMFIPIGSIILPISYLVVSRTLSPHYLLISAIIPLYIAFDGGTIFGYYNVYKYTFTYFLYFISLMLYLKINTIQYNYKTLIIVAIIVIYISMLLIHYTLAFLLLVTLIVDYIIRSLKHQQIHIKPSTLLIFVVLFILIKSPTIISYLQFERVDTDIFSRFYTRINTYLGQEIEPGYGTFQEANNTTLLLRTIRVLLIIAPIIYFMLYYAIKLPKNIPTIIWAIIITGIIHTAMYINIGSVGIISNYMLVVYPLIIFIILQPILRSYAILYLSILIIISSASLFTAFNDLNYSNTYESIRFASILLNNHLIKYDPIIQQEQGLLIDHRTMGLYALFTANTLPQPFYFTNETYDSLVNSSNQIKFTYAMLHLDNKPIASVQFNKYKPINDFIEEINNNEKLNRIFSDSLTIILSTKNNVD